jgi:hypothetical protein
VIGPGEGRFALAASTAGIQQSGTTDSSKKTAPAVNTRT